jgi:hypothetical protein
MWAAAEMLSKESMKTGEANAHGGGHVSHLDCLICAVAHICHRSVYEGELRPQGRSTGRFGKSVDEERGPMRQKGFGGGGDIESRGGVIDESLYGGTDGEKSRPIKGSGELIGGAMIRWQINYDKLIGALGEERMTFARGDKGANAVPDLPAPARDLEFQVADRGKNDLMMVVPVQGGLGQVVPDTDDLMLHPNFLSSSWPQSAG